MAKIKVELFHASWCGHCVRFLPEWKKFANEIKEDKSVQVFDYESKSENFEKFAKINGKPVGGFPTVKITVDGSEHTYNNERTAEALHKTIKELKKSQAGGAVQTVPVSRKSQAGGSVQSGGSVQAGGSVQSMMRLPDKSDPDYSRKILLYKIAKYEHKYNTLYNELRKKGIL
jgi:thiol-disulfide isomerase/thioredoxin